MRQMRETRYFMLDKRLDRLRKDLEQEQARAFPVGWRVQFKRGTMTNPAWAVILSHSWGGRMKIRSEISGKRYWISTHDTLLGTITELPGDSDG